MNVKKLKSTGRLLFTTDIHGELPTLIHGLNELGFNESTDLLVCAGDLIDRGRFNMETAQFFLAPVSDAYHSVLGNHDVFTFDTTDYNRDFQCWIINGGSGHSLNW